MQYHILVIDDDDEIRQLLAKYLNKNGYIVSLSPNTIVAERLFELFQFDLVILDVLMPKETGLDFLKRKTLKQPVIMLTALGDVDDRINGLESAEFRASEVRVVTCDVPHDRTGAASRTQGPCCLHTWDIKKIGSPDKMIGNKLRTDVDHKR